MKRGDCMDRHESPPAILDLSSEEAMEWIMDTYGESLKRFIYTYVKNRSQTDDLFQEVLVTVYQKIETFQERSSFKTWLYRIAANKCKDYLRSPINRLLLIKDQIHEKYTDITPEQSYMMNEQKHQLMQAIFALPIKYREVLILQYYKEFSIQEISELLKINPSTVRTRLMRAKERLKQELKEEFFYE